MIWIDFTLIGLVFVFFVVGLLRGFAKEVFSLGFWMLASWVSLNFNREFSVYLEPSISQPLLRMAASFVALFAITLCLGGLIGMLLSVLIAKTGLTFVDRLAGMVFGIVRGMIVVTVLVMLAGFTPLPKNSWWAKSVLIPPFQSLAVWLLDHISTDSAKYINYGVPLQQQVKN